MCENPDFFKGRVKNFIVMAPIIRIFNMKAEVLKQMVNDDEIYDVFQSLDMGLEILTKAPADNFLGKLLIKTQIGSLAQNWRQIPCLSKSLMSITENILNQNL